MNVFTSASSKLTLASVAMLASMGAQALTLSGSPAAIYLPTTADPSKLESVAVTQDNVDSALSGAGNVELGKFGSSPVTTLSGDIGGVDATLRSLTKTDWTYNSNALATAYITGAASSIGASLTADQLTAALDIFLTKDLGGWTAWQFVSDPNISDVALNGSGAIVVGLDGFLNGSTILNALFGSLLPDGVTIPETAAASEVVRVDYNNSSKYLFGFSATESGYKTADGSYDGRFTVGTAYDAGLIVPDPTAVPEPATLALFGLGFAGMGLMRRRSNA